MISTLRIFFLTLTLLVAGVIPQAYAQNAPENVKNALYADVSQAAKGENFHILLEQVIRPGWHTYWKNPGDSGLPLSVEWSLPDGVSVSEFSYPTPHIEAIESVVNFGFKDRTLFPATVTVPKDFQGESIELTGDFSWLVCDEICIPESQSLSLTIPVGDTAVPANSEIFESAQDMMPKTFSGAVSAYEDNGELALSFTPAPKELVKADNINLFPSEWGLIVNGDAPEIVTKTDGSFVMKLARGGRELADVSMFDAVVTYNYQGKEKAIGFPVNVTGSAAPMNNEEAESAIVEDETVMPDTQPLPDRASHIGGEDTAQFTFLTAILFAFTGGLILNLMPCVFPILSMKALSFVKLSDKTRKEAVLHGVSYTMGVILSMLAIAGLLIVLKAGGAQIGWGFQLQNPMIVFFLFLLFFLIGMNLMGVFEVPFVFSNAGRRFQSSHAFINDMATGALAVIVATPCTAPFMAVALGYAFLQPAYVTLFVFIALGLGLAAPFLLLAVVPALQRFMPKPGSWMVTFRQILSFPMFAAAIWLIWVLSQQTGADGTAAALAGLLAVIFLMWSSVRLRIIGKIIVTLIALTVFVKAVTAIHDSELPAHSFNAGAVLNPETGEVSHIPYTADALETALKGDDPVFVNMTAAWCITCKVNERTTLESDTVKQLFKDNHVHVITGDWTLFDETITAYLESFQRNGVPIYVYYPARLNTGERLAPVVLPQILSPDMLVEIVEQH
ncbi:MAG: protein-disulfide reductase DsbD family protein [Pseudobdellovibrionaceae bacterium]